MTVHRREPQPYIVLLSLRYTAVNLEGVTYQKRSSFAVMKSAAQRSESTRTKNAVTTGQLAILKSAYDRDPFVIGDM